MYKRVSQTRAALMGLLFAIVGFSFALATSSGVSVDGNEAVAAGRSVGSTSLYFTNPTALTAPLTDRDLGDVVKGSSFVRYARAAGGVRPYKFVASNASPTATEAISGTTATLSVLTSGQITGSMGNATSNLRFTIMVSDSRGTNPQNVTEVFRLTLDASGRFKFAVSELADGVKLQPYLDAVQVLNGSGALTFTAGTAQQFDTASSTWKDTSTKALEDLGLSISATDGTVFGKPFTAGTFRFTANCTDAKGNKATDRSNSAVTGQVLTVVVADNAVVASDVLASSIQVKIGTTGGKDSVKYNGIANLAGKKASSLSGKALIVRIGGYISPNTTATPALLDSKGKIAKPAKGVASKTSPKLTGSVNDKGQVKFGVTKETITGLTLPSSGKKALAVSVQVGDVVSGSQFLVFDCKGSSKNTSATYKFGGEADKGGEFLITSIKGKDDKKTVATTWTVNFLATPAGASTFGSPSKANVSVGSKDVTGVTLKSEKNGKVSADKTEKGSAVAKLSLDAAKGKGSLTTGALLASETNVLQGGNSKAAATNLGVGVTLLSSSSATLFAGEGALAIFPGKSGWTSQQPK